MPDKILCFSLGGYSLGVEQEQVEKILINKNPDRESFVLETGVEVKSLKAYIPLPERERAPADNIFFIKDQKDYYGFTVDRILGYLKVRGIENAFQRRERSPIKYFVRDDGGKLIPVLDLHFITNNENSFTGEDAAEITSFTYLEPMPQPSGEEAPSDDVDRDEVFQAIEEEIRKRKSSQSWDESITSEKKGIVLPLIVNVVIVAFVSLGVIYYVVAGKLRVREEGAAGKVSGVEEKVIEALRQKSEAELEAQRQKLKEAQSALDRLREEKDSFVTNQDRMLAQRERELYEAYERKLEEARKRLEASGATNVDEAFAAEKDRLYREYLAARDKLRGDTDASKREFERRLKEEEERLTREMQSSGRRIADVEAKLVEERAKLKEAESRAESISMQQQDYLSFRRRLNSMYNEALGHISRSNYPQGIGELKKIPPVIAQARDRKIADEATLKVEDDLARSLIFLLEREQGRANLDLIGQKTYEAAVALEGEGKPQEALSRYFTVYTLSGDQALRDKALGRSQSIMDSLFRERTARENRELEQKATALYNGAVESRRRGELDKAMASLEEVILRYPAQGVTKRVLDEIIAINDLKGFQAEGKDKAGQNQKAAELMRGGKNAYDKGFYAEAMNKYQEVATRYKTSDYAESALAEIIRINEEMRKIKFAPAFTLKKGEVKTGVLVQILPESSVLINLGTEDGVKNGDLLQVFRTSEGEAVFIGSLKVYETNPKTANARIVYFERSMRTGDIVSY